MRTTTSVPSLLRATEITASALGVAVTDELRGDVENHLAEGDMVYGIQLSRDEKGYIDGDSDQTFVGFAVFRVWDDILYLSGIMLDAKHQKREAVSRAVYHARYHLHCESYRPPTFLAFRTQSLRMWVAGSRETIYMVPRPPNANLAVWIAGPEFEVGSRIADAIGSDFPVGFSYYGGPLYGSKPKYGNRSLQRWWDGCFNYERGDAVICFGQLKALHWGGGW